MSGLWVIFKKEFRDALRDHRAVAAALLPAIIGPVLMMIILSSAAETRKEAEDVTLGVIGREHAPDLIAYLQENDVVVEEFTGDPKAEIQARNIGVVLSIGEDYGETFQAFETTTVELFADFSLEKSDVAADEVRDLISRYSRNIGALRLMVRGVNPSIALPVGIEIRDYSTRTSRASTILNSLQMFLLMAAFFGGAGVAIDTTAGERERKSWEPLLVHPMSSVEIIGGKWLTVALFAFVASLLSVFSTATALSFISLEALGVDPKLTPIMQLSIAALQIPMVLFASSIQMLVSLFAKTFKEAQAYLGMLTLLPMLPVMVTMFKEIKTATWMYLVPIVGQQQLMSSVMRGEGMETHGFVLAALLTTAVALVIFALLTRLLRSERVVFGG